MSELPEADHARIVFLRQQLADLEAEMRRVAEAHSTASLSFDPEYPRRLYTKVGQQVLAWAARLKAVQE